MTQRNRVGEGRQAPHEAAREPLYVLREPDVAAITRTAPVTAMADPRREAAREALASAQAAVEREPHSVIALQMLAIALHQSGDTLSALRIYERAISYFPNDAQVHYNHGVTLVSAGLDSLGMVAYARCLSLNPDHCDALWNYGELLRLDEQFEKALACFDRLLSLEGQMRSKMAHRMAVCCAYLRLDERAHELFEQQIATDDEPVSHWEYARFLLACGDLDKAWVHYAWRFLAVVKLDGLPYPQWHGEFRRDGVLVVTGEQGMGDVILFAVFLRPLLEQARAHGMRVVAICLPPVVRLLQASFGAETGNVLEVLAAGPDVANRLAQITGRRDEGVDRPVWWIVIGDLPRWVSKPVPSPWLLPDKADVTLMQGILGPRKGLRVGLIWRANQGVQKADRVDRSIPGGLMVGWLDKTMVAMSERAKGEPESVEFFSLQDAAHAPEIAVLAQRGVKDMSGWLTDFSRTAAAMKEMDVVVSVCTSTANLAGALGCDTRVLLRRYADWRWEGDGRWFTQVRAYRQPEAGNWVKPLEQLSEDLLEKISITKDTGWVG